MSENSKFNFKNYIDPKLFDFLKPIKENYSEILSEFQSISAQAFPHFENIYKGNWNIIPFALDDKDFSDYKNIAPKTCEILDAIPGICLYGFSIFEPETETEELCSEDYENLRGNLCLTTSSNAKIVIEGEAREWTPGEVMIYDHTLNHYSYNKGNANHVVLLFDFKKPENYDRVDDPLKSVPLISEEMIEE